MDIVVDTGKKGKVTVQVALDASVKSLKQAFTKQTRKDVNRVSFKIPATDPSAAVRLDDDSKTLSSYGLSSGSIVQYKDLGPQIGYRTVFLIEYFGPLVFVWLYALRPAIIFGQEANTLPYNWVASLAIICWSIHFLKREFETLFVHKFSHATMPLFNLFKNCAYYWFFGATIGYPLCSPSYAPPSEIQTYIGLAIFIFGEIGNLLVHLQLSNMRPAEGSTRREIPKGILFKFVACPNYTFEILSWVGFSIMTQIPFSYAFTFFGFVQMADWAQKKHRGYKKTYDKEYTKLKRKAIVPFIY